MLACMFLALLTWTEFDTFLCYGIWTMFHCDLNDHRRPGAQRAGGV